MSFLVSLNKLSNCFFFFHYSTASHCVTWTLMLHGNLPHVPLTHSLRLYTRDDRADKPWKSFLSLHLVYYPLISNANDNLLFL